MGLSPDVATIILYSFGSGITVFFGGLLSRLLETRRLDSTARDLIVRTSVATGGGILVAAVAFVLVPEGMAAIEPVPMVIVFLAGAVVFFLLDKHLETNGGRYSQLLAMLMDFVPEAIALGAVFATHHHLGLLIAIFIGLQNLPESFNSYLDLRGSGISGRSALAILFALSFSGVIAALFGYLFLQGLETLKGGMMLFAGGGIVYLIFQDIAPASKEDHRWFPALGASVGFAVGMVGQSILG
jgi:ZIP family zinc transporter